MKTIDGRPEGNIESLLPLEVIRAAISGNANAMEIVLSFYEPTISKKSVRKLRDQYGNVYYGPDYEICDEVRAKLMKAIVSFKE